jgi:hypothetical protein
VVEFAGTEKKASIDVIFDAIHRLDIVALNRGYLQLLDRVKGDYRLMPNRLTENEEETLRQVSSITADVQDDFKQLFQDALEEFKERDKYQPTLEQDLVNRNWKGLLWHLGSHFDRQRSPQLRLLTARFDAASDAVEKKLNKESAALHAKDVLDNYKALLSAARPSVEHYIDNDRGNDYGKDPYGFHDAWKQALDQPTRKGMENLIHFFSLEYTIDRNAWNMKLLRERFLSAHSDLNDRANKADEYKDVLAAGLDDTSKRLKKRQRETGTDETDPNDQPPLNRPKLDTSGRTSTTGEYENRIRQLLHAIRSNSHWHDMTLQLTYLGNNRFQFDAQSNVERDRIQHELDTLVALVRPLRCSLRSPSI